ncbi:P-II family nitrogen regulator [Rhodocyclus tenuis]|uniref:P-II family nitrogen regulator n=2 Tax=Rhodocyclus TaxID=1064 RepID=A0A6L5JUK9_RHOTE|nr:P-II family nitrogen regulator [Rhodocyclus gracilis]MQY50284.1 P-II family nitrogen regulator [Rhodocyclus gracilis]MRD71819.1 P-II family nitrogen regulator [Rhodocyclus gracilis]NJA87787.1 P-II family nitrogen regulator [Rhodocyclus gracilis]
MKEIKAVIRPNKLTTLRESLRGIPGFPGMTVSKAEGCSAPSRHSPSSIKEELTDFTPKVRIEIVAPDEVAEAIYNAIVSVAQTGHIGDGLVWMTDIERASFIHKTTGL